MKRMLLGTVVAIAVYWLLSFTTGPLGGAAYQGLSQGAYVWALALIWAAPGFLGSLCGAGIAGRRFILVALALWAVSTLYILQWGYEMQQPARPMTVLEYLGNQWPSLPVGVVGTLLGAWLGAQVAHRLGQKPNNSSKPTPLRGAA